MITARFTTITGDDWRRAMPLARERRRGASERLRLARERHQARVVCGNVSTRKEAP